MQSTLDFETDKFLELLTDALRAGPGSPSWHQAMVRLRSDGSSQSEQYRLLIETREHLESGREYRSIRAGSNFTRRLMADLEAQNPTGSNLTGTRSGLRTASFIAGVSIFVALLVIGVVVWFLTSGQSVSTSPQHLGSQFFGRTVLAAPFDGTTPAGWRRIGRMAIEFNKELRPSANMAPDHPVRPDDGCGLVTAAPIPDDQPVALLVNLHFDQIPSDLLPEVFVSDSADFSAGSATSPRELIWLIRDRRPQVVLPDGEFAGKSDEIPPGPRSVSVRLVVAGDLAMVETNGRVIWSGPIGLASGQPRYLGVRFRRGTGSARPSHVSVASLNLMEP